MKFFKVSGVVIFLHVALAAVLIFQSGCQTIQNSQVSDEYGLNDCPYVMGPQPIALPQPVDYDNNNFSNRPTAPVIKDHFMEASCGVSCRPVHVISGQSVPQPQPLPQVVSQSVPTGRFKPMRPTSDFSNDGLLTSIDDWKPTTKTTSSSEDTTFKPQEVKLQEVSYTVKAGDSLWIIAKRNNIGVAELANANALSRDAPLKIGQKLIVPVRPNATALPSMPPAEGATYTIVNGDTLSEIALRFKVSPEAIKKANNMQNNTIFAGKKIIIPGVTAAQIASATSLPKSKSTVLPPSKKGSYKVQNGDSLSVIASHFGVTVADLMTWNNMSDAKKLRAGQTLIVSDPNAPETAPGVAENVSVSSNNRSSTPQTDNSAVKASNYKASETSNAPIEEETIDFDLFEDDDLFDTSDEIPVIASEE